MNRTYFLYVFRVLAGWNDSYYVSSIGGVPDIEWTWMELDGIGIGDGMLSLKIFMLSLNYFIYFSICQKNYP